MLMLFMYMYYKLKNKASRGELEIMPYLRLVMLVECVVSRLYVIGCFQGHDLLSFIFYVIFTFNFISASFKFPELIFNSFS